MHREDRLVYLELKIDLSKSRVESVQRVEKEDAHADILDDGNDEEDGEDPVEGIGALAVSQVLVVAARVVITPDVAKVEGY